MNLPQGFSDLRFVHTRVLGKLNTIELNDEERRGHWKGLLKLIATGTRARFLGHGSPEKRAARRNDRVKEGGEAARDRAGLTRHPLEALGQSTTFDNLLPVDSPKKLKSLQEVERLDDLRLSKAAFRINQDLLADVTGQVVQRLIRKVPKPLPARWPPAGKLLPSQMRTQLEEDGEKGGKAKEFFIKISVGICATVEGINGGSGHNCFDKIISIFRQNESR